MKKNSITNKITPCCGLPFSVIYWWVSNLTLNSEADRSFVLSKINQNGTIEIDGWKVLINSGTLEADASLAKAEFLAWFDCGKQPTCEQLKLIVEGFKISNWTPETELPSNLALIDKSANGINYIGNVYTKEQTDVKIETRYNNTAETLAVDIIKRVDQNTGENVNYRETTILQDGTAITDANVDGVIYKKVGTKYFKRQFDGVLNVKWFGAKGDGITDDLEAFNSCFEVAKNLKCAKIFIPKGHYKFSDTWNLTDVSGLSIEGYGNQNITFTENKSLASCVLDFDSVPKDHDGISVNTFVGLEIKNIFVSYYRGEVGGTTALSNAAIRLVGGHDYRLIGLRINATHWDNTAGLILGGGNGETCAFLGIIEDVKVLCHSQSIGIGTFGGNTSLNFRSCYIAGGGYWHIEGTVYSSFLNCACDGAIYYGYLITSNVLYNSTNLSFISCGSESCGKTGFWIHDYVQNIDFLNPYDANNNTLNGTNDGALFVIHPNTWAKNIRITNPSSYSNNGTYSMVFNGNIDNIFVESTNKKNVRKGFGGGSLNKVSISGDFEWTEFTPTIESATITAINDIKAFWKKIGDGFELFLKIDGDFSTTSGSYIKLPFNVGSGIVSVVQLNSYAKPQMLVDNDKIWLPTMDIDTGEFITISAKTTLVNKPIVGM